MRVVRGKTGLCGALSLAAMAAASGVPTYAQTGNEEAREAVDALDIVVTAQRRAESMQDVPISIAVVTGEDIAKSGIVNFSDLQTAVSGITTVANGDARAARIGMRGITTAQENGKQSSVGVYVDGVFMSRVGMSFSDLPDLERVEVLRGPQGTLFGMNTSAGLIHMITKAPDLEAFGGFVEGMVGNYDQVGFRGRVSGPVIHEKLGFSLSGFATSRDGFVRNRTLDRKADDQRRWGARGRMLYEGEGVSISLIGDYQKEDSECCVKIFTYVTPTTTVLGVPIASLVPAGGPFERVSVGNRVNRNQHDGGGLSAEVNIDIGDHVLTSLTAVRYWDIHHEDDPEGLPLAIVEDFAIDQENDQFSQELRLASPQGGALEYILGAIYFDRRSRQRQVIDFESPLLHGPTQDGISTNFFDGKSKSYGVFARGVVRPLTDVTLSAGVRYTQENQIALAVQTANNFIDPSFNRRDARREGQLTWNLSADYRINPDVMVYVAAGRGFKPGGFDLNRVLTYTSFQFEEETALNVEGGVRSTLFGGKALLNATLFHSDYKNFQTTRFDGVRFLNSNAPKVRVYGLEIEASARLARGLNWRTSASFTKAKFVDFTDGQCPQGVAGACDLSGRVLPQAPKTSISSSLDYTTPIGDGGWSAFAGIDASYRSKVFFSQSLDPLSEQKGYGLTNARFGVEDAHGLRLEAWVKNLFKKDYLTFSFPAVLTAGGGYAGFVGDPRTYGIRVRKSF